MAKDETVTGEALVSELNDLLQLDFDSIGAYTVAIERVESVTYREALESFLRDHQRHVRDLSALVQAAGGTPVTAPHVPTGAFKLAVQALASMVGKDRELLLAFKTNEGQARDKYARLAARPHAPEVADVLRRAAADEEKHYEWAESRLAKLGAGPSSVAGKMQRAAEVVQGREFDAIEAVERKVTEMLDRVRN
jgi:rubrerythrin